MSSSEWRVVGTAQGVVFVEDLDGARSVTNDAEWVLASIKNTYGRDARCVYKDTEKEWWEILWTTDPESGDGYIGFERWHGMVWDILKRK